jgi:hypothetical protein
VEVGGIDNSVTCVEIGVGVLTSPGLQANKIRAVMVKGDLVLLHCIAPRNESLPSLLRKVVFLNRIHESISRFGLL